MRSRYLLLAVVLGFRLLPLAAQPVNDDCSGAILLEDVSDWCSEMGAFNNQAAGNSAVPTPSCFSGPFADVWFSFIPFATDVTATIIGSTGVNLLESPEIALYQGSCGALQEVACASGLLQSNVNSLFADELSLGLPYYLRIQSTAGNNGTFQLCINNYNPPEEPSSDCPEAAILCNKEAFVVQKLIGPGDDPSEANDADCLNGFSPNVEWHSAWFMWTAGSNGPLSFTLTPLNPPDDLDFVVYEFPNGVGNCADKIVLRCMASSCDGPTGLDEASVDFSEPPNCNDPSQDNFLAAIQMEAGKSYGIMVNNFSSTGIGFEMEFGGSGQFAGPDAAIAAVPSGPLCVGQTITLQDASTFTDGNIVGWEWSFGPGASIAGAQTPGPHELSWNTAGTKPVLLRLRTNQGCVVSVVRQIEVLCCNAQYDVQADITHLVCPEGDDGAISVQVSNPSPPYSYSWSNGGDTPIITGLPAGAFMVTITDGLGCDTILNLEVESPPPFDIDVTLVAPSCNGGADGSASLSVNGATPPYLFSWEGGPFLPGGMQSGLSAGDYSVVVQDARGCESALDIPLRELELELAPPEESILPPSCFDSRDASLTVTPLNGQPPYRYDFNDGNGWVSGNSLQNLGAGVYFVSVEDANQCQSVTSFNIEGPPPLSLSLAETPISCHGTEDGRLLPEVAGGAGSYSFLWNTGSTAEGLDGLAAGTYELTVTDGNGCTVRQAATLYQPAPLELALESLLPARCHGEASGSLVVGASGGTAPYEFALNGQGFQTSPSFGNLPAGDYSLALRDARGCSLSLNVSVGEPPLLEVEAGNPAEVVLGYEARLQALSNGNITAYSWQPAEGLSCSDCPSPVLMPLQDGWYAVRVEDENGCVAVDSVRITLSDSRPVFIPNAFSPNDDGRNDYFVAYLGPGGRQVLSMRIFGRWGTLLFEQENLSSGIPVLGWDGNFKNQPVPSGVYTYVIEVEFIDGKRGRYTGSVSLAR
ncbi:MAG: gliding motility-associated C-terminal domain-containing protein [Phaeodactylibacter sp.]|nr:gliding motility-associated C-terminal domain-containing protein [Phaeodactylibacter sp.]